MELGKLKVEYLDLREFLFKYFSVDLNPLGVISILVQIAIITWLVYQIYQRFQGTQAERVMRGLIMLIPIILVFYLLKMTIITRLIEILSSTILIGLIVIFAPEFRRVLMQLGGQFSTLEFVVLPDSKKQVIAATKELIKGLQELKENKRGALIAIEKAKVDRYYVNPGQEMDATLSAELISSIFNPKSPLHDGAMTVRGAKIYAARVILPMTENPKLDWQYGTRHRAAIGFTEVTDSLCIVVSEETGEISVAYQGRITKYSKIEDIKDQIEKFYAYVTQRKREATTLNVFIKDLLKPKEK